VNATYHPGFFTRVDKWVAEQLLHDSRDFWLCPSNCEPKPKLFREFMRVNAVPNLKAACGFLNQRLGLRKKDKEAFKPTREECPAKWPTLVACAWGFAVGRHKLEDCRGALGNRQHYYYEHDENCDTTVLGMALDAAEESGTLSREPNGPLAVLHYTGFHVRGWLMPAVAEIVRRLPNWGVRAPASLMQRVTTSRVSVNTYAARRPRDIGQLAFRKCDLERIFDFCRVPYYVFARDLNRRRYYPKDYPYHAKPEAIGCESSD
jgi:hypothetical protein